jgi:hypothetical protein
MCLLVLGFAGVAVLRTHEWPTKRTATERARRRARRGERRPGRAVRPAPTPPPVAAPVAPRVEPPRVRQLSPARRVRAGFLLVLSSIGIGVLTGVVLGLGVVAVGLALRSI